MQQNCALRDTPHSAYFDAAMATLLVPDLFYAEMAIPGFDPFQTSPAKHFMYDLLLPIKLLMWYLVQRGKRLDLKVLP